MPNQGDRGNKPGKTTKNERKIENMNGRSRVPLEAGRRRGIQRPVGFLGFRFQPWREEQERER